MNWTEFWTVSGQLRATKPFQSCHFDLLLVLVANAQSSPDRSSDTAQQLQFIDAGHQNGKLREIDIE